MNFLYEVSFSRDLDFHESKNFEIFDVIIDISEH